MSNINMNEWKIEAGRFSGEFRLGFLDLTTDYVDTCNVSYYNKDVTDPELLQQVKELHEKINNNGKYIIDTLTYSAVKFLAEDKYNIYSACKLGIINGEREEVLSDERIENLESYANSVNLQSGYEGYSGDITKYVKEYFPELYLGELVDDYDLFEGIMLDGKGGFQYCPDGNSDIWEGDVITVSNKLFASLERH